MQAHDKSLFFPPVSASPGGIHRVRHDGRARGNAGLSLGSGGLWGFRTPNPPPSTPTSGSFNGGYHSHNCRSPLFLCYLHSPSLLGASMDRWNIRRNSKLSLHAERLAIPRTLIYCAEKVSSSFHSHSCWSSRIFHGGMISSTLCGPLLRPLTLAANKKLGH